jgi:hypothetical protein
MVMKKFSDLKAENIAFPEAEFINAEAKKSIMNKTLEFIDIKEAKGEKGDYLIVLAKDGSRAISFSIGGVVANQLKDNKKGLPFSAKIVEKKAKATGRMFQTLE